MKKEDMQKEQAQLVQQVGYITIQALSPIAQILGAIGRIRFLESEIQRVTPKPEEKKEESK
jgi:hypothetical protein